MPVESDGSGQLAYALVFGRQRRSWTIPRGGSGALTDALVRCIGDHGGTVICGKRVTRLLLSGGRCTGVETDEGERYTAREAVVSTIHVKHLLEMAPADLWDEGFRYGVDTFDVGVSAMAAYMATTAPPVFETPDGPRSAVSAGLAAFPREVIEYGRALRDGRYVEDPAWVLVACPTLVDPSRAPAGHHTVKFLSAQSYGFPERKDAQADRQLERVQAVAPGFTRDVILERLVKAPEDIEAANPHMIRGTFHGGNRTYPQSGALRPAPGWASHRMPIDGPLPDRRHDAPGRLDHRRAGPQRRGRAAAGPRPRPRGGGARVPDTRVQSAIDHWAPRFVQAGVDYSDFTRTTARRRALGGLARRVRRRWATPTREPAREAETAGAPDHRRRRVAARRRRVPLRQVRLGARRGPQPARSPTWRSRRCTPRTPPARPDRRADRGAARRRRGRSATCAGRRSSSARRWCS